MAGQVALHALRLTFCWDAGTVLNPKSDFLARLKETWYRLILPQYVLFASFCNLMKQDNMHRLKTPTRQHLTNNKCNISRKGSLC